MVEEKEKVVLIFSGGMDSTTLLYDLISKGKEVWPITFLYGQKHSKEIKAAMETCSDLDLFLKIVDMSFFAKLAPSALTTKNKEIPKGHYEEESMKLTVVPNRNMVFLALAASYAIGIGAKTLYYGAHGGDHAIYPDCRTEFVHSMRASLKLCDWSEVYLSVPYLDWDKTRILKRGLELGIDYSGTWTCYEGKDAPCGKCGSCTERLEAFKNLGKKDPLEVTVRWGEDEREVNY